MPNRELVRRLESLYRRWQDSMHGIEYDLSPFTFLSEHGSITEDVISRATAFVEKHELVDKLQKIQNLEKQIQDIRASLPNVANDNFPSEPE